MQQTVRLLGDLGERYGSEHKYHDLRSPAEAIKLLCINEPAFLKELTEAHHHGIGYTVVQADEFLDYGDLHLPLGKNDLIVTPVVTGSGGGGVGKVLAGVGLIAAAVFLGPSAVIGGAGFLGLQVGAGIIGGIAASAIGAVGASLVLGGVSQMLSPQPTVPTIGGGGFGGDRRTSPGENTNATGPQGVSRAVSGEQSYAFSGPANTVGVGATVPLVYGKLLIGSHLISSKVEVTSESDPTGAYFLPPGRDSITVNGEKPTFNFEVLNGLRTRRWFTHQVKLKNQQSSNGRFKKRKRSDNLFFNVGEIDDVSTYKNYESDESEFGNFQLFLELDQGLSRVVGSQLVPAFVTYEITTTKENYTGESPVFTRVRATIQGLLKKTDNYKWCHAFTYGETGVEDSDTVVRVKMQVIDTDADNKNGRIKIRGAGYEMFRKKSQNNTKNLVTETET
jgi:predicted phage tail protein|tara:strand:+ start:546 stop:1892 length:1347 start_codon:yes stop_codon:yes gene_type:complete